MEKNDAIKRIEYPQLKKIGGLRYFAKKNLIKIIIILLIASLAGGLFGFAVQKSFRNLTGYNKAEPVLAEVQTTPETGNSIFDEALKAVKDSEFVRAANTYTANKVHSALSPVTDSLNGLLKALDTAAFWLPFILIFIISAWLTNKLMSAKKYLLSDGIDPQIIRNMEVLEAKVKELVDHANAIP